MSEKDRVTIPGSFVDSLAGRWESRGDVISQAWFEHQLLNAYADGVRAERAASNNAVTEAPRDV